MVERIVQDKNTAQDETEVVEDEQDNQDNMEEEQLAANLNVFMCTEGCP